MLTTLSRLALLTSLLMAPLSAHAQERSGRALSSPHLLDVELQPPSSSSDELPWRATAGWSSIGALAVSLAVIIGTQVRNADIGNDARWLDARTSFSSGTNICVPIPSRGVVASEYLADTCAELDTLEVAWSVAMGVGTASMVSAIIFFALDATHDEDRPSVSVSASPWGARLDLSGRF